MRLIRFRDLEPTPWKNGGGVTREVARLADPEKPGAFLWRVSIATVDAPGPFSPFPGIDRTIAVLDGDGIRLDMRGGARTLTPSDPPFAFDGEEPVHCTLPGGATTDLNVMTRRGRYRHDMTRLAVGRDSLVRPGAGICLLAACGPLRLQAEGTVWEMETGDTLAEPGSGPMRLSAAAAETSACLVTIV
ncbi:HutD/Ves family protein [Gellertiella hungarica]|uniref:HutD family protein n=1 Tax=Gellertiella hungarica TaxID=1572859 RepID=A0A7W6NMH7_9HYPH|nr:HutD family protein [Gellertiella hungarica]MBB4066639.1 hypothetical protein [Gellertiella hungarica]